MIFILLSFLVSCWWNNNNWNTVDNVNILGNNSKEITTNLIWSYSTGFHELDLSRKDLTELPNFELYLTWSYKYDVWSINLQDNNLEDIDATYFDYFPNLQEINLSYNNITWDVSINHLFLQKLLLHKNKISNVNLSWSVALSDLNLWYNEFKTLEGSILPKSITNLELQHNSLENLSWIDKLESLSTIKFEFNKLEDTDLAVIKNLKYLMNISFWENLLTEKMEEVLLKFNEIKSEGK